MPLLAQALTETRPGPVTFAIGHLVTRLPRKQIVGRVHEAWRAGILLVPDTHGHTHTHTHTHTLTRAHAHTHTQREREREREREQERQEGESLKRKRETSYKSEGIL